MSKCRYCGLDLSTLDYYRAKEHPKACKNVPEEFRIGPGINKREKKTEPPKEE